jgi:inorganic pyrophosphatase
MQGNAAESIRWAAAFAAVASCWLLAACASLAPDHLRDENAVNEDLTVHVVIENPAGTSEKWEVGPDGRLAQDLDDGVPISIRHLPWPVNGGMIPRTLLSAELGGDGEAVDVLVLGPAIPRGSLVRARPIGLLRMLDRLERDDKVLAVTDGSAFAAVVDIDDLDERFPGVTDIIAAWFAYSGPTGRYEVQGFGSRAAANRLVGECALAFEEAERSASIPAWGE